MTFYPTQNSLRMLFNQTNNTYFFSETNSQFSQNAPSQMIDRALNTSLLLVLFWKSDN